tara:strand:+ start:981 stop:1253 length:273 start_codon:yes stop_codon:yes gene_type:complete
LSPAIVRKIIAEIIVIKNRGRINGPSIRVRNAEYLSACNHLLILDLFPIIPRIMYEIIAEVKIIAAYPGSLLIVEIKAKRLPVPKIKRNT